MLKVQPRFKLDRSYKGPFQIESLTSTNAVIQLVNDNSVEPWNVSRQRLSKCRPEMEQSKPWVGHSNKPRERRKLKCQKQPGQGETQSLQKEDTGDPPVTSTRCGRAVQRPSHFLGRIQPEVLTVGRL